MDLLRVEDISIYFVIFYDIRSDGGHFKAYKNNKMNKAKEDCLLGALNNSPGLRGRRGRRSQQSSYRIVGNYEIRQQVGVGGFAKVKRAIHLPTGMPVAVKIVPLMKLQPEQKNNLMREIEIHKMLIHQNIAQVYEVQEANDRAFIFMEYCSKGQLFDLINRQGPLPKQQSQRIFQQVYSAVRYLHQCGIAHRDIKTENILLDEKGNAKLIDFGLSSYYDFQLEDAYLETFCGSPSYISPEMMKKDKYQPKMIDVWCLGVALYAMLEARLPFYAENPSEQKRNIRSIAYSSTGDLQVDQLLSAIFLPVSSRITLEQMQNLSFMKGSHSTSNSLTFEEQSYAIDEELIERICQEHGLSPNNMKQSLKQKNIDNLYSLYYLTLEKNRRMGLESHYDVKSTIFMKFKDKRKSKKAVSKDKDFSGSKEKKNTVETASTFRTRSRPAKLKLSSQIQLPLDNLNPLMTSSQIHPKRTLDLLSHRHRRNSEESPDSPRKYSRDDKKIKRKREGTATIGYS